jgi:branched-chain amino acid aminotransferase
MFVTPVGPYFKGGFGPDQGRRFMVSAADRAAPNGTGHVKAGGNYACSFSPGAEAKRKGYDEAIYLDPAEHRYIEEIGAANFLALIGDTLVTPDSHSVLPSITRRSIMRIASDLFEWPTEHRKIAVDELDSVIRRRGLRDRRGHHLDQGDRGTGAVLDLRIRRPVAAPL